MKKQKNKNKVPGRDRQLKELKGELKELKGQAVDDREINIRCLSLKILQSGRNANRSRGQAKDFLKSIKRAIRETEGV